MTRNWEELRQTVCQKGWMKGNFVLHGGQVSERYFDKYLVLSDPELALKVAQEMILYVFPQVDYLAGLETGGMVLATILSLLTGFPVRYVRKCPKEHGTRQQIEGGQAAGRCIIIEDVVTTGKAVLGAVRALKAEGGEPRRVLCMVDREAGGKEALLREGLELRSVFTISDFPD